MTPFSTNNQGQPIVSEAQIAQEEAQTNIDLANVNREIADNLVNLSPQQRQPFPEGPQPEPPGIPVGNTTNMAYTITLVRQGLEKIQNSLDEVSTALGQLTLPPNQPAAIVAQGAATPPQNPTGVPTTQAPPTQAVNQAVNFSIQAQDFISRAQSSAQGENGSPVNPPQAIAAAPPAQTLVQGSQASEGPLGDIQQVVQTVTSIIGPVIDILGLFL